MPYKNGQGTQYKNTVWVWCWPEKLCTLDPGPSRHLSQADCALHIARMLVDGVLHTARILTYGVWHVARMLADSALYIARILDNGICMHWLGC